MFAAPPKPCQVVLFPKPNQTRDIELNEHLSKNMQMNRCFSAREFQRTTLTLCSRAVQSEVISYLGPDPKLSTVKTKTEKTCGAVSSRTPCRIRACPDRRAFNPAEFTVFIRNPSAVPVGWHCHSIIVNSSNSWWTGCHDNLLHTLTPHSAGYYCLDHKQLLPKSVLHGSNMLLLVFAACQMTVFWSGKSWGRLISAWSASCFSLMSC